MNEKTRYWVEISDYDLETAEAMLRSKRYLYVGFMCHQTIEKIFKANFSAIKSETAPYSHSLSYLAKQGGFYDSFTEKQKDFIDQIEPLNIETRYPSHKERLLKSLSEEKCSEILQMTKELQQWIKEKL
ncbi:MAG: HEPN domain-containing protein [Bacteroidota bacterium]|nr:HEPN domain-containing protein [Bacteroidota bacterium]